MFLEVTFGGVSFGVGRVGRVTLQRVFTFGGGSVFCRGGGVGDFDGKVVKSEKRRKSDKFGDFDPKKTKKGPPKTVTTVETTEKISPYILSTFSG